MKANTDFRSSIGPLGILVTWQPATRIHTSKNVIHASYVRGFTLGCPLLSAHYIATTIVKSQPNQMSVICEVWMNKAGLTLIFC